MALTRKRSTFGRDGLNLGALKGMTEGDASSPEKFWEVANNYGFSFNWGYATRGSIAYFSSGYLPVRAPGLDRRLPTWGTGEYEWQGFLEQAEHPHAVGDPSGRLLNWNNQAAPGFMHGDDAPYGSVHRVELFDKFPEKVDLAGVVGVMNRSATEDVRSPAWPVISEVLRGGDAPSELAAEVVDLLEAWVEDDAPRLDADDDGFYDHAGPTIMDALFEPLAAAVMRPVFGDLVEALDDIRDLGGNHDAGSGSVSSPPGASFVDKDLRTLLGKQVEGEYNLSYCGNGSLENCRDSLWQVVEDVSQELASEYGGDPDTWLREGHRRGISGTVLPTQRNGPLLGWHSNATVHSDHFCIDVRVGNTFHHCECKFLTAAQSFGKQHGLPQMCLEGLGVFAFAVNGCVDQSGSNGVNPNTYGTQVPCDGKCHANHAAFGSRVRCLADLSVKCGTGGHVDDGAAAAVFIHGLCLGHRRRCATQYIESPDQVDLDDKAEFVEV